MPRHGRGFLFDTNTIRWKGFYLQELSGTVSPDGTISKNINKNVASSISPSGVIIKQINSLFSSNVLLGGDVVKVANNILSSDIPLEGNPIKQINKILFSSLSLSGNSIGDIILGSLLYVLSLGGTISPESSISQTINKNISADIELSSSIMKVISNRFVGTITPSGSVSRSIAVIFGSLIIELISKIAIGLNILEHTTMQLEDSSVDLEIVNVNAELEL
jgi:hypothetical protein